MSGEDLEGVDAASFPRPPVDFADGAGREIAIRAGGDGPVGAETDALVAMYATFDPADRAQGLPPAGEAEIRAWLDRLLGSESVNVLAWHGEAAAGHATLVPDGEGAHELAIFVHQDYQGAGIGTRLIECLLGAGADSGVGTVWLTVERWNRVAVNLYRKVGFETTTSEHFELEMGLELH